MMTKINVFLVFYLVFTVCCSLHARDEFAVYEGQVWDSGFDFKRDTLCFENATEYRTSTFKNFITARIANRFNACHGIAYLAKKSFENSQWYRYGRDLLGMPKLIESTYNSLIFRDERVQFPYGAGLRSHCEQAKNVFKDLTVKSNNLIGVTKISGYLVEMFLKEYSPDESRRQMAISVAKLMRKLSAGKTALLHYKFHTVLAYKMEYKDSTFYIHVYDPNNINKNHVYRIEFDRSSALPKSSYFRSQGPFWIVDVD